MRRERLVWSQLQLTPPVAPEAVRACLVGLATLPGRPRVICEAIGQGGAIRWRIGVDAASVRQVRAVLTTQLPGLRIEADDAQPGGSDQSHVDLDALSQAASVQMPGSRQLPLRADATPAVTRALLGALASTRSADSLWGMGLSSGSLVDVAGLGR